MIKILAYQFYQLLFPVFPERGLVHKTFIPVSSRSDKRNFSPDNQAIPVAQIIHILVLRIMCQTNGIHAHFEHNIHIFLMILRRKSISGFRMVLMTAHPPEFQMFAIQKKSLLRVNPEITQSQRLCDPVCLFPVF